MVSLERRREIGRAHYHRSKQAPIISDHPCECGCGQFTYLASRTSSEKGWRKGEPKRFAHGHNRRRYHTIPVIVRCSTCRETKPSEEFHADSSRPTGRSSACKVCAAIRKAEWYSENRGAIKERMDAWRADNVERNRELKRKWQRANPEKRAELQNRRRTRKKAGVVEKIDPAAIYARDGGMCHICGKKVGRSQMSLDHLIPVSKGGHHVALNVRLAHLHCNVKRGAGRTAAQLLLT